MKPTKLFCLLLVSVFTAAGLGDQTEKASEPNESLHQAAGDGDLDQVRSLIAKGADVNRKDKWGYTPLYYAIWNEDVNTVKVLVAKGADVNVTPKNDGTPLEYAVWNEDKEMAEFLVAHGAKPDAKDSDGWTAFRYAASGANRELVEFFVDKGADVSGIHGAALMGDLVRVKRFVQQGIDVDAKDEMGWTALYCAASMGRRDAVEFLIAKGADIEAKAEDRTTPLHQATRAGDRKIVELFISKGADVNAKDKRGNTPLHSATSAGQQQVAVLLIDRGAGVDAKGRNSWTPLHNAARQGHGDMVELLLAKGADLNTEDSQGRTPLWWANRRGHREITELLRRQAINNLVKAGGVNVKDKDGRTPLHHGAEEGLSELVKELIVNNADVDAKDTYGQTPLHCAAHKGHKNVAECLLAKGAHVDARDNAGRTPLHYAVGAGKNMAPDAGHMEVVQLFLDKGANINAKETWGWTPLHYAVRMANKAMVELLVEKGADLNAVDERGHTPLSLAQQKPFGLRGSAQEKEVGKRYGEIADLLHGHRSVYYLARNGKDSNPGTLERPFSTLNAAISAAEARDTIFVRGGVYVCENSISIDKSGDQGKLICLRAYPGEIPVFDFSRVKGDAFLIKGAYWHIKGLTLTKAENSGITLETEAAHHNILEQVTVYANRNAGLVLRIDVAHNLILNCDSYENFDPETDGENADGFGAWYGIGRGNVFIGCRAWNNSDDGFDLWDSVEGVRVENCYAWRNGENIWNHPRFTGNANGFKLGQMEGAHLLIRCVAWGHPLRGFDLNGNSTGVSLYNCTAFRNNVDFAFMFSKGNIEKNVLRSNLSYKGLIQIRPEVDDQFNSWNTPPGIEITEEDFLSLDDTTIIGPRNPDGSIPRSDFLRLAPGSDAIGAGTDVDLPFVGRAPDLGAFEYNPAENGKRGPKMLHQAVRDRDTKQIRALLSKDTDVNEKDWLGYAALHWAIYFGYLDVAEILLSERANPNLKSDTGRTPLEIATAMEYAELAELLRNHGAKE